jgi:hypothetical protein
MGLIGAFKVKKGMHGYQPRCHLVSKGKTFQKETFDHS